MESEKGEPASGLLGVGLYSVLEASRLTGVSRRRIRGWMRGYRPAPEGAGARGAVGAREGGLWRQDLPELRGSVALSFLDLVEVRVIAVLRERGIPWSTIRTAAMRARRLFDSSHPFALRRIATDGRTLFAEVIAETGETKLLDLVKSQYAFKRVISPNLMAGVDFDRGDEAKRWWPLGKERQVVIDPARAFGKPVIAASGIPTFVLAEAVRAGESRARVAERFGLDPDAVKDAVAFEKRLAPAR